MRINGHRLPPAPSGASARIGKCGTGQRLCDFAETRTLKVGKEAFTDYTIAARTSLP